MLKQITALLLLIGLMVIAAPQGKAQATSSLVKSPTSASVYYVYNGKRYAFPNEKTFFTWYANFSSVEVISEAALAALPLAGNVTYRPGIKLVKITTDPKVYAVADGGVLRWVTTEALARLFHGDQWQKEVHDVPDAFFSNYTIGNSIKLSGDFNPVRERDLQDVFVPRSQQTTTLEPEPPVAEEAPLATKYARISTSREGGFIDHISIVGDKIAVGDGINIRIDDITQGIVRYSIWGKNTANACKLLSTTGWFRLTDDDRFREFTDSFFEVTAIGEDDIQLRQWYGKMARERCDEIAGWKTAIACSFYDADDRFFVENRSVRTHFYGENAQLDAEYYTDAFNNCREAYIQKIPALASVTPIGRTHWDVYEALVATGAYSADYQRISLSQSGFNQSEEIRRRRAGWVENGACPAEESPIAHESAHVLFARTPLQDIYDGGSKTEWVNSSANRPGSMKVSEGFAQFMAHYVLGDAAQQEREYWQAFCGKDQLIDAHPERDIYQLGDATESQRQYSEVLAGRGYGSNHYLTGYCFYDRIQTDCGENTIAGLLSFALQYSGSTASHPTIFRHLADQCGEAKIGEVMDDFGFDRELFNLTQKWPNTGFSNGLDAAGCIE